MNNTKTVDTSTINPEKIMTDKIDITSNYYENYRYGKLIKTETSYISSKVITDDIEQEKLEAIYTLTFIDNKTKEKESFQSYFLPKLNEKYFYYIDNNLAMGISNNKNKFAEFIFDNTSLTDNEKEHKFMSCISMILFFMSIILMIISHFNPTAQPQGFITFIYYFCIFGTTLSSFIFGVNFLFDKKLKNKKVKIKQYIDDLL